MAADIEGLLSEAMKLPPDARGILAARILESLEEGETLSPSEWERAWGPELKRRMRDLDSGAVQGIPWSEVERELEEQD